MRWNGCIPWYPAHLSPLPGLEYDNALKSCQKALDLTLKAFAAAPANVEVRRSVTVAHRKIGDVWKLKMDFPAALTNYRTGLGFVQALVTEFPDNARWQSNLSFMHQNVGDVLQAKNEGAAAIAEYRRGLDLLQTL